MCSFNAGFIPNLTCIVITVTEMDQQIDCFAEPDCRVGTGVSSIEDCCNHGVAPFGVTYSIPGLEICFECPVGKCTGLFDVFA